MTDPNNNMYQIEVSNRSIVYLRSKNDKDNGRYFTEEEIKGFC